MISRTEIILPNVNRLLRSPGGPVVRDLMRRGTRIEMAAKRHCPKRSGKLRDSIRHEIVPTTARGVPCLGVKIYSHLNYAAWVMQTGSGMYGSHSSPIVPTRSRVLRFTGKDGEMVFTPRVAGQRPQRILRVALIEGMH